VKVPKPKAGLKGIKRKNGISFPIKA